MIAFSKLLTIYHLKATVKESMSNNSFRNIPSNSKPLSQQHGLRSDKALGLDLLEVFCGPQSQLTAQSQKLGYRAERFSMSQGDLQTSSGRESLFMQMVNQRPRRFFVSHWQPFR